MIFISHRHSDAASIDKLTAALDRAGVAYWIDRQEIDAGAQIQQRIETGLAQSHALLAWFSVDYPRSRACQWEITAALIAARGDATPKHRVLVVNPAADDAHLRLLAVRDIERLPAPRADQGEAGFNELAQRIKTAIADLPGPLSALRRLGRPPAYGFQPLGSNRFVGRIDELWQIHDALARGDHAIVAGQPHVAAAGQLAQVQGSGGIGKSLLAEEYALRFGAFWPGGVFWLRAFGNPDNPAESPDALAQRRAHEYRRQLDDFADELGIAAQETKDLSDAQLRRRLGKKLDDNNAPWLWIVDDLPACTRAELEPWLTPGRLGQTLITTRSRRQDGVGCVLALDTLPPHDARALLTRDHPPTAAEEPTVAAILQRLDGHALALDIARSACQSQGYANFLRCLESPGDDALELAAELAAELPNGHNPSIAATFLVGFADLPDEGRDVLRLAAQLAVAPIERWLVAACFGFVDALAPDSAETRAERGIRQTVQRSLAEEQASGESGANLLMHTLVSRTLRFHDADRARQSALRTGAIEALNRVMAQGNDIRRHGALRLAALHATELATAATTESELRLAVRLGRYDYEAARYAAATDWLQQAFDGWCRILGDEHPDTLASMNNLADTLRIQGNLTDALELQKSALARRQRILGVEHPDTLISMGNLASTLLAQGNLIEAIDLQKSVLEAHRRIFGDEHKHTITSMNNLAETLRAQGNLVGAIELQKSALTISQNTLGDEHPLTLISMGNLAQTHRAQGDLASAFALQQSVLAAHRSILGDEHPDTLTSINNLANILQAQGDVAGALDLERSALVTCRRILGDEHPHTLSAMNNLAETLRAQGDLGGALALQKSALAIRRRTLGNEHPGTLTSMNNLAGTLKAQGDLAGALDLLEPALAIQRSTLGDEHPDTLSSMNNLAEILRAKGDFADALDLHKSALAIRQRTLGDAHPNTLKSMGNLASTLQAQGDLVGALELKKLVLTAHRRTLGDEHPDTLTSINNLASTLHDQGNLVGALDLQKSVLTIRRRTLGDAHPHTLNSAWNLFVTAFQLDDTATAVNLFKTFLFPLLQADPASLPASSQAIRHHLNAMLPATPQESNP